MKNNWIYFVAWVVSCLLLIGCKNDLDAIERLIQAEEVKVETINNFQTLYSDSAVIRVRLQGPKMVRHLDKTEPRQEFPEGVKVEFFSPNKIVTSRLTARYAIRYEKEGRVIVRDSVVWESPQNETLETEELIWDEKTEKVFTNKFVTVRREDEILYGYGFESNQDFTRSRIKAIEGKIKIDQDLGE